MKMENSPINKNSKKKSGTILLLQIIAILIFVFIFRTYILGSIAVKGSSMEPNFKHGDIVIINKLAYNMGLPKKNDIAICELDSGKKGNNIIKRVIGLPNDEINLVMNENSLELEYFLYVNGERLDEPYLNKPIQQPGDLEYPFTVPENSYFVMGDNRNASTDSRTTSVGTIEQKNMVGKVVMRVYPFSNFGSSFD